MLPPSPRFHPDAQPLLSADGLHHGRDGEYIADPGLIAAANVAMTMGLPLLLTGEPGCGKTDFAYVLANAVREWEAPDSAGGELLECHVRSDSRARDLLYHYDALARFGDGQHGGDAGRERAKDARHFVELQALGVALVSKTRRVVLIDEIDKAPRDLPNDLLRELDRGEFEIPEIRFDAGAEPVNDPACGVPLGRTMRRPKDAPMPVMVITSNVERQLPDPFLRRCVFYHILFPGQERLQQIVKSRFGGADDSLSLDKLVVLFLGARRVPELIKKPSTAELLHWVGALLRTFEPGDVRITINALYDAMDAKGVIRHKDMRWTDLPGVGCLFKLREDLDAAGRRHEEPGSSPA
jgi:MoxR-like ATPase